MSDLKLPRGREVILTNHAIEQFRERALEGMGSLKNAKQVLGHAISRGKATPDPPNWQRHHRDADAWLGTPRLSLPLVHTPEGKWIALTTCHYDHMDLSDEELIRKGALVAKKGRL